MTPWFYAAGDGQRQGPLPTADILALYRAGHIDGGTLLWREGAPGWQPLRDYAGELGLPAEAGFSTTPSTPPLPPPVQHVHHGGTPADKPRLSGCVIALIVAAIAGVMLICILAILAAIAVPAYQEYTLRSRTSMAHSQLLPLKTPVVEFVQQHQRCPVNGDEGFHAPEDYAGMGIASLRIGGVDNGHCGLEARLAAPGAPRLDGKHLRLDYDAGTGHWKCSSEVDDRFLPVNCRG